MHAIQEVYPEWHEHDYGPSNYQPLLASLGHEILLQVDDRDYQGDSRLLLKDGARVGYLMFGWGSCSGCDALQAANTYRDLETLRSEPVFGIRWFDSVAAAHEFFATHDWEGDHAYNSDEQTDFVARALALLSGGAL